MPICELLTVHGYHMYPKYGMPMFHIHAGAAVVSRFATCRSATALGRKHGWGRGLLAGRQKEAAPSETCDMT